MIEYSLCFLWLLWKCFSVLEEVFRSLQEELHPSASWQEISRSEEQTCWSTSGASGFFWIWLKCFSVFSREVQLFWNEVWTELKPSFCQQINIIICRLLWCWRLHSLQSIVALYFTCSGLYIWIGCNFDSRILCYLFLNKIFYLYQYSWIKSNAHKDWQPIYT